MRVWTHLCGVGVFSITASTGTFLSFYSSVLGWLLSLSVWGESCGNASFFPLPDSGLISSMLAVTAVFSMTGADGNIGLVAEVCNANVFMKSLCISDWSGSWSGQVHSRGKSPSSVPPILARPEESSCSTSSTGKTTRQQCTLVSVLSNNTALLMTKNVLSYLETVFKFLADKVEGNWVNAGVKRSHVDADVIHH